MTKTADASRPFGKPISNPVDPKKPPKVNKNAKIPESLLPDIILFKAQGKSLAEIKDWLLAEHNISVDVATISRRTRYTTKLDRTLAQAIYARASAKGAEGIVNAIIGNLDEIHKAGTIMLASGNMTEYRQLRKLELDYIDAHSKLFQNSKIDKDDEIEDIDTILARLGSGNMVVDTTITLEEAHFEDELILEEEHHQLYPLPTENPEENQ